MLEYLWLSGVSKHNLLPEKNPKNKISQSNFCMNALYQNRKQSGGQDYLEVMVEDAIAIQTNILCMRKAKILLVPKRYRQMRTVALSRLMYINWEGQYS